MATSSFIIICAATVILLFVFIYKKIVAAPSEGEKVKNSDTDDIQNEPDKNEKDGGEIVLSKKMIEKMGDKAKLVIKGTLVSFDDSYSEEADFSFPLKKASLSIKTSEQAAGFVQDRLFG